MKELLFIVHRIPYPPNKGDKIRSYHLLNELRKDYKIHLATFIDDKEDLQYQEHVASLCESMCAVQIDPFTSKIRSLKGLLTSEALSIPYYENQQISSYVEGVIAKGVDKVLVFSSTMAQFVISTRFDLKMVVDFVDIDSDKWRQYSQSKRWPASWIYNREYKKLFDWEHRVADRADYSLFVSDTESQMFKQLLPSVAEKVHTFDNAVDYEFFTASTDIETPYSDDTPRVVFTGAMDYWANVDAVKWFAEEVLPLVQQKIPVTQFYIVGSKPTAKVSALQNIYGVTVTGRVEDVRPYIQYADLSVAPIRIARGVQNKVLEAMSMGNAVVATSQAMEGIKEAGLFDDLTIDEPQVYADKVVELLQNKDSANRWGEKGRDMVIKNYSWQANVARVVGFLEG
ncbi:MAG: TIGR03087 family PEP-CTERM/XrtA system glycosyltransferase [Gammaproteobacteria bacterium]|nr:MAG: TIGR03087 family PEP-CTERM/XrtA system glycosyltransferase [Gammaproteobacteria bacterium]